ncbi:BatD family protein [Methylocystis sp. JAN1]|uniref:BatD family protein n=1 Tax=Methylocystis sp. JAN1 TaxID=3397211 RepID=UPI003FA264A6
MRDARLRFLVAVLFVVFGRAAGRAEDAPVGRFEAFVESPKETPYVGEPLRLVLRAAIRARVASERIEQPALTDFDWRQFGVDASSEALIDGFWTPVHTRTLMIYPLRAGRLTIEPFKWRVAYVAGDGGRAETEAVSQPFAIDVRTRDGLGDSGDFWLPATALRLADRWEPEPDKIPFGETAQRVVTVEADGLTADRLPTLPRFRAPGLVTFSGPVERQTIVTDQGPVARAVYRWNVRPLAPSGAVAPAIRLRWFDVSARTMREAAAPERRVAFIDAPESTEAGEFHNFFAPRPLLAALLGFVSTGAAAYLVASSKAARGSWRLVAKRRRLLGALDAAARNGDAAAFRRTLDELSATDPDRWRQIAAGDDLAPALARIDAAIFAREPPTAPALAPLARRIARALRRADP